MITLTSEQFTSILPQLGLKLRIKNDLKFGTSTETLGDDWSDYEQIHVADKAGKNGVLLWQPDDDLYGVAYELSALNASVQTGRAQSIICDFCYTWQRGSNAASITLTHAETKRGVRFLCCADLKCSEHVRTQTKESILSRTQLRENLTDDDRVARLKERLSIKITDLRLQPILL